MTHRIAAFLLGMTLATSAAAAPDTAPVPVPRPETGAAEVTRIVPVPRPAEILRPVAVATKSPRVPEGLPRQIARAETLLQKALQGSVVRVTRAVLPAYRPLARPVVSTKSVASPLALPSADLLARSPLPATRPSNLPKRARIVLASAAAPIVPTPGVPLGRKGSVCGDPSIRGERLSPIAGRISGCGVEEPVRVTAIDGVKLSQASVMDCRTATAIKRWIGEGVRPAIGRTGGGVSALRVAAHYSCRTRNNQPGAKISEHGKGRAIDISAIVLASGEAISVLDGWRDRTHGPILKRMHAAACGPFGTVLGPNSDRFHQDHFHFDTARYRAGTYCR